VAGGFGPFATFLAGGLHSALSSRPAADLATSTLVGRKGAERPPPPKSDMQQLQDVERNIEGMGGAGLPSEKDMLEGGSSDTGGGVDHGFTSTIPWGVLDDFFMPAARVVTPYIAKLPFNVRLGAFAGVFMWGGKMLWDYTEDFRDAPEPPPPKGPGYP
jgi:hypothetical protein